jgi:hypothetical protein
VLFELSPQLADNKDSNITFVIAWACALGDSCYVRISIRFARKHISLVRIHTCQIIYTA